MAKKAKGNRVQVILECTEMKESGLPGTSRYITCRELLAISLQKIERIQLKDWNLRNTTQS